MNGYSKIVNRNSSIFMFLVRVSLEYIYFFYLLKNIIFYMKERGNIPWERRKVDHRPKCWQSENAVCGSSPHVFFPLRLFHESKVSGLSLRNFVFQTMLCFRTQFVKFFVFVFFNIQIQSVVLYLFSSLCLYIYLQQFIIFLRTHMNWI